MNKRDEIKPLGRLARRDFLKLLGAAGFNAPLLALGGGYISQIEPGWLEVTQVRLALPRLPGSFSGFRLVQISDIHMGGWMNIERLTYLLDIVLGLPPNWVAITGDFVMGHKHLSEGTVYLGELESKLKLLTTHVPTVAVLGNHDYKFNVHAVLAMLERSGVQTLVNTVQKVQIGDEFIYFGGVDDVRKGVARLDQVVAKLPAESCAILMAHEPDFADKSAATGRFDLEISGHSHGGQVNLPFIGPPFLPYMAHKYPSGLYRVGPMFKYTNRGASAAATMLIEAVCRDTHDILPISFRLEGEYGVHGLAVSVPAQVGAGGVEKVLPAPMSASEKKTFAAAADELRAAIAQKRQAAR